MTEAVTQVEPVPYHEILDLKLGGYWWGDREDDPRGKVEQHLTLIGDVDLSEPNYSFDLLRFYVRPADGMVLYATDSGCSCPSPFEDITVGELRETSVSRVADVARELAHGGDGWGSIPVATVVRDASALIERMIEAGAQ